MAKTKERTVQVIQSDIEAIRSQIQAMQNEVSNLESDQRRNWRNNDDKLAMKVISLNHRITGAEDEITTLQAEQEARQLEDDKQRYYELEADSYRLQETITDAKKQREAAIQKVKDLDMQLTSLLNVKRSLRESLGKRIRELNPDNTDPNYSRDVLRPIVHAARDNMDYPG